MPRRLWMPLIFTCWFFSHQGAMACKCGPTRPACEVLGDSWIVFAGTVTDTGPTIAALMGKFKSKLTPREIARLEDSNDLSFAEVKRIWARLLPKEALPRLDRTRTEEQLQRLTIKYFPLLGEWQRPVRFSVDETFKGEHVAVREVWTGQGFGDCGFDFEFGHRYLVYAYHDAETARDETGICSRTREFDDSSDDVALLRGIQQGTIKPRIFGVVTSELEEFRARTLLWTGGPARFPVSGIHVGIESKGLARSTVTNASGQFEFGDLPAGEYVVTAEAAGYRFKGLPNTVLLKDGSCSVRMILAERANANQQ